MSLLGREGISSWTAADGATLELNRRKDDDGDPVHPYIKVRRFSFPSRDAQDNRDARVGADGEIPRTSRRRGRTVAYEGIVSGCSTARELREYQAEIRTAFSDTREGRMDVFPHPLNPDYAEGEGQRYFNARVIGLEMDDIRDSQRYESTFVLGLRMSDARYFEELTLASFKQWIIGLDPLLYWALNLADGATDLSGNGRHGTGQGGISIGGAAALTAFAGDSATDFGGYITSGYNPFSADAILTYFALISRDGTGLDTIASGVGDAPPILQVTLDDFSYSPAAGGSAALWSDVEAAPGSVAVKHDEGAGTAELFLDGSSQGELDGLSGFDAAPGNFQLGRNGLTVGAPPGHPLDGKLSHVALFGDLAAAEIAALHEGATTGRLSYW